MSGRTISILARGALLGAAILWGASFVFTKGALGDLGLFFLNAINRTIAFLVMGSIFFKRLRQNWKKEYLVAAAMMALFGCLNNLFQCIGMNLGTTPGKSAFLISLSCAIVPFLDWLISKKRPTVYNFSAAVLCVIGTGFVAVTTAFTVEAGDAFTLLGSLCCAAYYIVIRRASQGRDPMVLMLYHFMIGAVFFWIAGFATGETLPPTLFDINLLLPILYLSLIGSGVAGGFQAFGQKHVDVSSASILMSLESVFGVLFSVLLFGEILTPRLLLGFALIFVGVIVSETQLSFLHKKKR